MYYNLVYALESLRPPKVCMKNMYSVFSIYLGTKGHIIILLELSWDIWTKYNLFYSVWFWTDWGQEASETSPFSHLEIGGVVNSTTCKLYQVLPGSQISEQRPRKMQQKQVRKIDEGNKVRRLTQIWAKIFWRSEI